MPAVEPDVTASAMVEEKFKPLMFVTAAPDHGQTGDVELKLYTVAIGPGLFAHCYTALFEPQAFLTLGEHAVAEGKRLTSGLVIAGPQQVPGP